MLLSLMEIIDIVVMSAFLGYIFSDFLGKFAGPQSYDVMGLMAHYSKKFNWNHFLFSVYVTAPAIILHEFGHKFVAMSF